MQFKDYYQLLGVERKASAEEVKKAYRRQARKYHPDVSKEADAEERFKEVQEAYEVLKDPEKRAAYDQLGSQYRQGQEFRPPPDWGSDFSFSAGGGAGGFSDFFEQLFGGAGTFGGRPGPRGGFQARGGHHEAELSLPLETAFSGGTETLSLREGAGTRQLKVRIPAGVTEGQVIRLAGQGGQGPGGRGDLLLRIKLAPHPLYALDGRDVSLVLPVAPWEAALGAVVPVPTLAGRVDLKVPAGARAGQRLRLKGRGLPGKPPGDQYAVLQLVLPPMDTPGAREWMERMRDELPFDPRAGLGKP